MKNYLIQFGTGQPTLMTGLTPTMVVFKTYPGGTNITPPGITEIPTSTGLYYFSYSPTLSMAFVIDGGSSVNSAFRYLSGNLDPIQAVDEVLGSTASSFESTSTDPSSVIGYLKRMQEYNEGNSSFTKSSGVWDIYARGNSVGASTLLIEKTLTTSETLVTKT